MCVSATRQVQEAKVRALTVDTLVAIGLDAQLGDDDIIANSDYVGEVYAIPAASTLEAIKLVAETEGLLLDPVYTGKAMAFLIVYFSAKLKFPLLFSAYASCGYVKFHIV